MNNCSVFKSSNARFSENGGDPLGSPGNLLIKRNLVKFSDVAVPLEEDNDRCYWKRKVNGRFMVPNVLEYNVTDKYGLHVPFTKYQESLIPGAVVKMVATLSIISVYDVANKVKNVYAKVEPIQMETCGYTSVSQAVAAPKKLQL